MGCADGMLWCVAHSPDFSAFLLNFLALHLWLEVFPRISECVRRQWRARHWPVNSRVVLIKARFVLLPDALFVAL
eukprot:3205312-Pyramimonas_sp.AAC.1